MWNHSGKRFFGPDGLFGRSNSYDSLVPPGTKACDAGGGAFRPEWREGRVRTVSSGVAKATGNCLKECPLQMRNWMNAACWQVHPRQLMVDHSKS
jgi:hypothetical protein